MSYNTVNVTSVEVLDGHNVVVTFNDGARRERDLSPLLKGQMFDGIRSDPNRFAEIAVDHELGVLYWPNGLDVDAELLRYDDLWDDTVKRITNI